MGNYLLIFNTAFFNGTLMIFVIYINPHTTKKYFLKKMSYIRL